MERENERLKFIAVVHGAKFDDKPSQGKQSTSQPNMLFGDPESYKDMSPDERQALTEKMMGYHKRLVKNTPHGRVS